MENLMRKFTILIVLGILLGAANNPNSVMGCPTCSGSVPWTDGTNGEAESKAYNDSIYFLLAAPTAIVLGVAIALIRKGRPAVNKKAQTQPMNEIVD
jgi:hypothetical protein